MVVFSRASKADIENLKLLWKKSFFEDDAAVNLFFERKFDPEISYIAKADGYIASSLYLLPVCLTSGERNYQANYLYGASTDADFRKSGIMGGLIEYAAESARKSGDLYSILLPANKNLYKYYEKFGYERHCFIKFMTLTASGFKQSRSHLMSGLNGFTPIAKENYDRDIHIYRLFDIRCKYLRNNAEAYLGWNVDHLDYALEYNFLYNGMLFVIEDGYAVVCHIEYGSAEVKEIICPAEKMKFFLESIILYLKLDKIKVRTIPNSKMDALCAEKPVKKEFGMVRCFSQVPLDNIYIGLSID